MALFHFKAVDENPGKIIREGQSAQQASLNIVNKLVSNLSYESNFKIQKKNQEREAYEQFQKQAQQQYNQKNEIKPTKKLDDLFGLLNDNSDFNIGNNNTATTTNTSNNNFNSNNNNNFNNNFNKPQQNAKKDDDSDDDDDFVMAEDEGNKNKNKANNINPISFDNNQKVEEVKKEEKPEVKPDRFGGSGNYSSMMNMMTSMMYMFGGKGMGMNPMMMKMMMEKTMGKKSTSRRA